MALLPRDQDCRTNLRRPGALAFCIGATLSLLAGPASSTPPMETHDQLQGQMSQIKAGSFVPLYGSREQPEKVEAFFLDVSPVTNGDYLRFVIQKPQFRRGSVPKVFADEDYLQHFAAPLRLGEKSPMSAPVTNVSWFTARAYCASMGKRLPTMNEWEYVARAGKTTPDASADPAFTRQLLEWYGKPTRLPLPTVSTAKKNYWGVAGMHGLVWEWVEDFNSVLMTGASRKDAGGLDTQLYCAAGSVGSVDPSNYAAFMRYAMRASTSASYTGNIMGFRCAKDVPKKKAPEKQP